MSQPSSIKRKSSSVHRIKRIKRLSQYGISMDLSEELEESGKDRCESFLEGARTPSHYPGYAPSQVQTILRRGQDLNEGRL